MTREIKFRAWDREESKMGEVEMINIVTGEIDTDLCLDNENNLELMQYTGLKDKNGVEIYEGDILKGVCRHNPTWENKVIFTDGSFMWSGKNGIGDMRSASLHKLLEITGHIYENPELTNTPK
jgi:uncharacterized phage protein (TIGR01671 family)